ncbi:MAG: acyltransferase, partial [Acidimicrobiia bacterium]
MVRGARRLDKLEALRGAAALYVFAHHYALKFRWNQYHLGSYATVAVMMFFLLSGFVIYRSSGVSTDTFSLPTYVRKRALRIVPAYLVALLLSYFVDRVIRGAPFNVSVFLGNMAFLVDSRFVHGVAAFHGNVPLWSLSYEVWFYVFFAAAVLGFGRRFEVLRRCALAISVLGLLSVWLVPNPISQYASAFVIWWAGAELAREYDDTGRISWRGQLRSLATMTCVGMLVALRIALVHGGDVRADRYQRSQLSHL